MVAMPRPVAGGMRRIAAGLLAYAVSIRAGVRADAPLAAARSVLTLDPVMIECPCGTTRSGAPLAGRPARRRDS
jgi:hypothetical protein